MADVYIVNLKDNRENHDKNDDIKFETCMRNKIISIGWGSEKSRENPNFKAAINNLNRMKKGDLVWVRNPKNKNDIRLLKIADDEVCDYMEASKNCFIDDISAARKIEDKIICFPPEKLPNEIEKKDIVARHTLERVHRQFLIDATLNCAKEFKGE
ncbi:MAG: hypothetical protein K2I14_05670 [Eubacterium sp.]|nr:hypothetical protein [Eubacterium sp.]